MGRPHGVEGELPGRQHERGGAGVLRMVGFFAAVGGMAYALDVARRRTAPDEPESRPEIERSISVEGQTAEALKQRWREPETARRIMAPYAELVFLSDDRVRWHAPGLGDWTMRREGGVDGGPARVSWISEDENAPLKEITARFREGAQGGSVVTLHLVTVPAGGPLGSGAARLFGDLLPGAVATRVLHSFKALVQTGEIPTTAGQPAARRDTR